MTHEQDSSHNPQEPLVSDEQHGCCGGKCQNAECGEDEMVGSNVCEKCEEYLAGWKRAQADYANLKKTSDKERLEVTVYGQERLLQEILPAVDQFETALEFLPDIGNLPEDERKKMQNWLVGIRAVKQLWEQTFNNMGIEHVSAEGMFDPNKHFAVGQEHDSTKPPETILRVLRPGWTWNGKVLRPANVIVNGEVSAES